MSETKKSIVSFHFENEEIARMFLGWMCDAGGEQGFDYVTENEGGHVTFDYHTMNDGKFGPNVKGTWEDEDG